MSKDKLDKVALDKAALAYVKTAKKERGVQEGAFSGRVKSNEG